MQFNCSELEHSNSQINPQLNVLLLSRLVRIMITRSRRSGSKSVLFSRRPYAAFPVGLDADKVSVCSKKKIKSSWQSWHDARCSLSHSSSTPPRVPSDNLTGSICRHISLRVWIICARNFCAVRQRLINQNHKKISSEVRTYDSATCPLCVLTGLVARNSG